MNAILDLLANIGGGGQLKAAIALLLSGKSAISALFKKPPRTKAEMGDAWDQIESLIKQGRELLNHPSVTDEQVAVFAERWPRLNATKVRDLPHDDDTPTKPPAATAFPYGTMLHFHPLTTNEAPLLKPGDRFYQLGTQALWVVEAAGSEHTDLGAEWRLIMTM